MIGYICNNEQCRLYLNKYNINTASLVTYEGGIMMGIHNYKFYAIQYINNTDFYVSDLSGMLDVLDSEDVCEFKTYEDALALLSNLPKHKIKYLRIVEIVETRRITICTGWRD